MLPYRKMISKYGLTQSMSRKGNCFDNAAIESFFGTLKGEFFRLTEFDSIEQLDAGVHDYIHYYNHERIKLKLNGLSPVDYRSQFATQSDILYTFNFWGTVQYRGDSGLVPLAHVWQGNTKNISLHSLS